MNNPTPRGARSPDQRLPKVKWFTLVFGFALLFLGYKTMSYSDPRLPLELSQAIETLSRLFFALGGLSVLVTIAGFLWRSPLVKLLELAEAVAYVGAAMFLFSMRGRHEGGGLFDSPILPAVLLILGSLKTIIAAREFKLSA